MKKQENKMRFALIEQICTGEAVKAPVVRCIFKCDESDGALAVEAFVRGFIDGFLRRVYTAVRDGVDRFDMPYEEARDAFKVDFADNAEIEDFLGNPEYMSFSIASVTSFDDEITDVFTVSKI